MRAYLLAGSIAQYYRGTCRPAARQPVAAPAATTSMLLGQHASMHQVRELIVRAARTSITVSVSGEKGTGKELAAVLADGPQLGACDIPLRTAPARPQVAARRWFFPCCASKRWPLCKPALRR